MSEVFSAERLLLNVAEWAAETTSPNAGAGTPAAIGSWWQRQGAYPGAPTEVYLKGQAQDTGWLKQNVVNLNVFNVKDPAFGAKGDGITDDTAAIQAAVNAANAAGGGVVYIPPVNVNAGQFYRITKPTNGDVGSIMINNLHNITLFGDGAASKIEMFDDSGASQWVGIYVGNGSTYIEVINLALSGEGVTNGDPAFHNDLIDIAGQAADANRGTAHVSVRDVVWGATLGSRIRVSGYDAAHTVSNVLCERSSGGYASCRDALKVQLVDGTASFVDLIMFGNNFIAADAVGVFPSLQNGLIVGNGSNTGNMAVIGNIVDHPVAAFALQVKRGLLCYNILNSQGRLACNTDAVKVVCRGNIVTNNGVSKPTFDAQNTAGAASQLDIVGNVFVQLFDTGFGEIVTSFCDRAIISDNIASTVATNPGIMVSSGDNNFAVVDGNICVSNGNGAATGAGFRGIGATIALDGALFTGNLVTFVGANSGGDGIQLTVSAALNMSNVVVADNLFSRVSNGMRFIRGTGLFLNWRGIGNNNVPGAVTSVVTLPSTNAGVSQEGPAGPGAQIALGSATPVGNVSASQGSLCADTVGGQATSIWYKETGVGVSGGTAGWLGIGGYDLVFGALNLSTTLTALFLAPGGDGLATPSATEIQGVMTRPATVRNLRSKVAVAGTGAGTVIHTVRKNGVDTALTVTVTNTSTSSAADTTHSFTVVAGDLLSVKITKTATITTAQTNCADTIEIV